MIKTLKSNIFFIFAFTLAFLAFSLGNSTMNSQKERLARYDGSKNRLISVESNEVFKRDEIVEVLSDYKVSIQLSYMNQVDVTQPIIVTTEIKSDGIKRLSDLRYGSYLNAEDYKSQQKIGVFSTSLTNNDNIKLSYIQEGELKELEVNRKGKTFDTQANIDVPNNIFFDIIGREDIFNSNHDIFISGEKDELNKSIEELRKYLLKMDSTSILNEYNFEQGFDKEQGSQMFQASILIIVMITLNSICIAFMWIQESKKELVIRKVCGANNFKIFKEYFKKILPSALISIALALGIQYLMLMLFKGMVLNLDLRLKLNNLIYTFLLSIGVTFIASVPALMYITKIKPIEMLREE